MLVLITSTIDEHFGLVDTGHMKLEGNGTVSKMGKN
jgi:hypothetical protein